MHWFWRGMIAVSAASLPYALVAEFSPPSIGTFLLWPWARSRFLSLETVIGEWTALWLLTALAMLIGFGCYWLLSWRFPLLQYDAKHCVICQYDLAGNTSGVCPECGERI